MSNRCVLYWLCGDGGYAETMAVSIASLRRWYDGPIVIARDWESRKAATELANTFDVEVKPVERASVRRHAKYVTKASLWRLFPGKQVAYLDADTVVCEPINRLFTVSLHVTQFSDWNTEGKKISGRLDSARRHLDPSLWPEGHDRLFPAINTGVLSWYADSHLQPYLEKWERLCLAGWSAPLTDELMLQLMLGELDDAGYLLFETDAYNWSPTYGKAAEPVIMHFHGRRHVRRDDGRQLWEPHARQALVDYPKLREWWGKFDPHVAHLLEPAAA